MDYVILAVVWRKGNVANCVYVSALLCAVGLVARFRSGLEVLCHKSVFDEQSASTDNFYKLELSQFVVASRLPPVGETAKESRYWPTLGPHKEGWAFMRTSAQSSLATVLLLIPILAVPMLAIFGVPQFTPAVASPFDDSGSSRRKNESEAPPFSPMKADGDAFDQVASSATDDVPGWSAEPSDRAARVLADRRGSAPDANRGEPTDPSPFGNTPSMGAGRDGVPGTYRRPRRNTEVTESLPPKVTPRAAPTVIEPQLTWRDAVQKLNQLEIRNFRLEPGQQPLQFVFSCSYTPRDNPRVSYRFEAEADEPLRAVERVLEQIDTWLAAR